MPPKESRSGRASSFLPSFCRITKAVEKQSNQYPEIEYRREGSQKQRFLRILGARNLSVAIFLGNPRYSMAGDAYALGAAGGVRAGLRQGGGSRSARQHSQSPARSGRGGGSADKLSEGGAPTPRTRGALATQPRPQPPAR